MAIKYINNFNDTTTFSDVSPLITMAANSVKSYTVPGEKYVKYQVIFGYNSTANIFVGLNQSPTIPAADTINASARNVEFRPKKRFVKGGDVLYFVTPDTTAYMGFSLREIEQGY